MSFFNKKIAYDCPQNPHNFQLVVSEQENEENKSEAWCVIS